MQRRELTKMLLAGASGLILFFGAALIVGLIANWMWPGSLPLPSGERAFRWAVEAALVGAAALWLLLRLYNFIDD